MLWIIRDFPICLLVCLHTKNNKYSNVAVGVHRLLQTLIAYCVAELVFVNEISKLMKKTSKYTLRK